MRFTYQNAHLMTDMDIIRVSVKHQGIVKNFITGTDKEIYYYTGEFRLEEELSTISEDPEESEESEESTDFDSVIENACSGKKNLHILDSGCGNLNFACDVLDRINDIDLYTSIGPHIFADPDGQFTMGQSLMKHKNLEFIQGLSHDIIPDLNDKYDLIIDRYGPFECSPNMIDLIETYYDALKKDGICVIFSNHEDDSMFTEDGVYLFGYLKSMYPDIFIEVSSEYIFGSQIIMKKKTDTLPFSLKTKITVGFNEINEKNVDYTELFEYMNGLKETQEMNDEYIKKYCVDDFTPDRMCCIVEVTEK